MEEHEKLILAAIIAALIGVIAAHYLAISIIKLIELWQ